MRVQRRGNSHGGDFDVPVEHSRIVCETARVAKAKVISTISHLLGVAREVDITTYRSGELGQEVGGEAKGERLSVFFRHDEDFVEEVIVWTGDGDGGLL